MSYPMLGLEASPQKPSSLAVSICGLNGCVQVMGPSNPTGEECALPSFKIDESPAKRGQWENFISFKKLQRIMVYVMRILLEHSHFRTPDRRIVDFSKRSLAKAKLLSMAQRESFYLEIKNLLDGKHLHPKRPIPAYSPFIIASGLMPFTV